ncbi:MAG: threonine--tRNA ligase [bacterium]|nr:threonine--tRNA ligase [bacterium]
MNQTSNGVKIMPDIQLNKIRHSLSHIMAAAVGEIFPGVKFGIGPAIENGFYYDFDLPAKASGEGGLSPENLPKIEKRMKELIKQNISFKRKLVSKAEAKKIFKNQPYKLELLKDLPSKQITVYQNGEFVDLCAGPHIKNTKEIDPEAFNLIKIAGAYWKGDEKNPMLTRIYGLAFETKKELDGYISTIAEAQKRDHRRLGQDLDLFSIHESMGGPGLIYWHPKAGRIRVIIEDFWRQAHYQNGYEIVFTPHIGKSTLWETSGHLDFYKENMYSPMEIDENEYYIKPMNCPFHILIYKNRIRSYRDLPMRWAELGTVYRYEKAGVLHGLLRVRGFTQDDAHLICTPEQMPFEIKKVLDFCFYILKSFGFNDFHIYLSTKPKKKSVGSKKMWEEATLALEKTLKDSKLDYSVDEGGGAFYGPKIDIKIKDALGREWQCSTIQFDFNMPEKFKMEFVDKDGKTHRPYMIHRALMGSLERFFGMLLEHYAGALPLWLSPVQAQIINIGAAHITYAQEINSQLSANGIRVSLSDENLTVSKRIREAEIQKIPYVLVVGDKELQNDTVNIRHYRRGQEGEIKLEKLLEQIKKEIADKTI